MALTCAKTSFYSNVLLSTLFLVLAKPSNGQRQPIPFVEKSCGVLHSEDNFNGAEFLINAGDQFVKLASDDEATAYWNTTGSISIAAGCKMEICNDTYFDGKCETLEQGSVTLSNLTTLRYFSGEVASASCMCNKVCWYKINKKIYSMDSFILMCRTSFY